MAGYPAAPADDGHLPAVRSCSAAAASWCCARCRSWPSGCLSAGGSRSGSAFWSLAYVRFWIVKTLVRSNPLTLPDRRARRSTRVYLRALGAGRARRRDLLPPGAGVHRPAHHRRGHGHPQRTPSSSCYRARAGWIQTGAVTLGRNVFVGEKTRARHQHLDGRRGAARPRLRAAQRSGGAGRRAVARLPGSAHRTWTTCGSRRAAAATLRRAWFCAVTLLCVFFLYLPLAEGGVSCC